MAEKWDAYGRVEKVTSFISGHGKMHCVMFNLNVKPEYRSGNAFSFLDGYTGKTIRCELIIEDTRFPVEVWNGIKDKAQKSGEDTNLRYHGGVLENAWLKVRFSKVEIPKNEGAKIYHIEDMFAPVVEDPMSEKGFFHEKKYPVAGKGHASTGAIEINGKCIM